MPTRAKPLRASTIMILLFFDIGGKADLGWNVIGVAHADENGFQDLENMAQYTKNLTIGNIL
jgi:hypothetical protein